MSTGRFFAVKPLLAFVAISVAGCGGSSSGPDLGTVTGVVKIDGQPAADLVITFEPIAGGRRSIGKTDEEGMYKLAFSADRKGALIGSHRVIITTASTSDAPDPSGVEKDRIPPRYNTETEITKEVVAGSNEIDVELTL